MPFYAIFEGTKYPTGSSRSQSYYKALKPHLREQNGLIEEVGYFNDNAVDGMLLSSWTSEEAMNAWRTLPTHLRVQQAAREEVFASYRIRIGVEAEADGEVDYNSSNTRITSAPGRVVVLYQRPIATTSQIKIDFSEISSELTKSLLMEDSDDTTTLKDILDQSTWVTKTHVLHVSGWSDVASAEAFEGSIRRVPGDWRRRIVVTRDYTKVDRKEAPPKTELGLADSTLESRALEETR